jgi:hypothetical protein
MQPLACIIVRDKDKNFEFYICNDSDHFYGKPKSSIFFAPAILNVPTVEHPPGEGADADIQCVPEISNFHREMFL